jgi:hypothetical protein
MRFCSSLDVLFVEICCMASQRASEIEAGFTTPRVLSPRVLIRAPEHF